MSEAALPQRPAVQQPDAAGRTTFTILAAISFCHLLNDMMQSLLPALYPMLKSSYELSFGQIGFLTFTFQLTASLLQPIIGSYTDRSPRPYSLATGMGFTLAGLLLLAFAGSYALLLLAAALIGTGSSVFHPESSRVARMASGGQHGLAQSVFQVGGNVGSAVGPLLAAFIVLPHGQSSVGWFSFTAMLGMFVLFHVGHWYKAHGLARLKPRTTAAAAPIGSKRVARAIAVLLALIFSKYFYLASFSSYYTFYLINRFHVSLFAEFLAKMRATKEGGGTLLDHSLLLYGSGMGNPNLHDHDNLPILVAGGAAGRMRGGRHIRFARPTPLANLHLTLLDKVGVRLDKFGDSNGKVGELFEPVGM